jgi:putative SOS response-associated peptidase YedK
MCGRTRSTLAPGAATAAAGVPREAFVDEARYQPSANACPGHYLPVLCRDGGGRAEGSCGSAARRGSTPVVRAMKWGLVPSWTKAPPGGAAPKLDHFKLFNARSETVDSKGIFSRLTMHRRGVLLVDGFYEWVKDAAGEKQPFLVQRRDGRPLKLAVLFDVYHGAGHAGGGGGSEIGGAEARGGGGGGGSGEHPPGEPLYTFTILTSAPARALSWLHDRQPVVLDDADAAVWADTATYGSLQELAGSGKLHAPLFTPYGEGGEGAAYGSGAGGELVWHPVDKRMNSIKYQQPDAGDPVELPPAAVKGATAGGGGSRAVAAAAASHRGPTLDAYYRAPPSSSASSPSTAPRSRSTKGGAR